MHFWHSIHVSKFSSYSINMCTILCCSGIKLALMYLQPFLASAGLPIFFNAGIFDTNSSFDLLINYSLVFRVCFCFHFAFHFYSLCLTFWLPSCIYAWCSAHLKMHAHSVVLFIFDHVSDLLILRQTFDQNVWFSAWGKHMVNMH